MKKFISIILTMILVFSLSSCKNDTETNTGDTSGTNDTGLPVNVGNEDKKDSDNKDDISSSFVTYKVAGESIYIDVPNYQKINKGFTEIFILHGYKYVAVTAHVNERTSNIKEAHEIAFEKFKSNIQSNSRVNSINITKDSIEKINGIEVYKYEGTLNCELGFTKNYDVYCIGYSFIMDDIPCTLIGSIIDEEQKQEDIDEMRKMVEASIKTLRSEE